MINFAGHLGSARAYKGPQTAQFCAAVLLALSVLGCGSGPSHLDSGKAKLATAEFQAAADYFTEALRENPREVEAYFLRGQAHAALNEFPSAAADYREVLRLSQAHPLAPKELVMALLEIGKGEEALEYLALAEPSLTEIERKLIGGRARLQAGDVAEARKAFADVIARQAENADAHYLLGLADAKLGEAESAERDFTAAIQLDGTHSRAYWQRALVRERLKKHELAEDDRKRAAELDPRVTFAESSVGKNVLETLKGRADDDKALDPLIRGLPSP